MNNRNWIAVFLGLACLVLFVGVISTGNFMNNTNTDRNNGATPQQINQTITDLNRNSEPNENLPTKINGDQMIDDAKNMMQGNNENSNNDTNKNTSENNDNNLLGMPY